MLDLSQTELADELGITFQQVQKYEKGANRISASRLQHASSILQVPISFFFEGLPGHSGASKRKTDAPFESHVSDFLATSDGLSLTKALRKLKTRSSGIASSASSKRSQAKMRDYADTCRPHLHPRYPQFHINPIGVDVQHGPKLPPL